jgi:hypothetical protein
MFQLHNRMKSFQRMSSIQRKTRTGPMQHMICDDALCKETQKYREELDHYLECIGKDWDMDLRIDHRGICTFQHGSFLVVIEVPKESSSFFVYTCLMKCSSNSASVMRKALELNYLAQETSGCTLALDPTCKEHCEMTLCYSQPIMGLDRGELCNVVVNFTETAAKLQQQLAYVKRSSTVERPQQLVVKQRSLMRRSSVSDTSAPVANQRSLVRRPPKSDTFAPEDNQRSMVRRPSNFENTPLIVKQWPTRQSKLDKDPFTAKHGSTVRRHPPTLNKAPLILAKQKSKRRRRPPKSSKAVPPKQDSDKTPTISNKRLDKKVFVGLSRAPSTKVNAEVERSQLKSAPSLKTISQVGMTLGFAASSYPAEPKKIDKRRSKVISTLNRMASITLARNHRSRPRNQMIEI